MSNDFLGLDRSGNDNNWTVNNMTLAADQVVDSPTNNFATWNPLTGKAGSLPTLSEGNLSIATQGAQATMNMPSGKWYFEALGTSTDADYAIGITEIDEANSDAITGGANARAGFIYQANGNVRKGGDGSIVATWATYTNGDIVSFSYDTSNRELKGYKNNNLQGTLTLATPTTDYVFTAICLGGSYIANFGQDSSFAGNKTAQGNQDGNDIGDFYYTPPTGFLALCTKNLPDATVTPSEHFNTVLYSGNGGTQSITGFGFQPDWIWDKSRNQAGSHMLVDAVRGVGKYLRTNLTSAEGVDSSILTSFDSDGVTVGDINGNASSSSSVMWGWKANGSGSSNTNGSINSTVSANVDAGFSIVTYTGNGSAATVGHGLSKAPEMITVKNRENARNWRTYHKYSGASDPETDYLNLDETGAVADYISWNDTAPTSSVFSITSSSDRAVNYNGETFIAYCFHSVDGYSKVGSMVSNNSTDGTFVYLGFQPKFVLCKGASFASDWTITDNERELGNPFGQEILFANDTLAETTYSAGGIDFVSNGFKVRSRGDGVHGANSSGATFIFIAFAETPFKYSNAR